MIPEGMDMGALLSQAQAMQEQLAQVQEEMATPPSPAPRGATWFRR